MSYEGDQKRAYQRKWMADKRAAYMADMGGACVKCGSTEKLEVDHIERSTKKVNPTHLWSRRHEIIMEELAKCQLLCEVCHQQKTSAERIAQRNLQHGEYGMYKLYKCRCEPCRTVNRDRVRMQRARKKARENEIQLSWLEPRTHNSVVVGSSPTISTEPKKGKTNGQQ